MVYKKEVWRKDSHLIYFWDEELKKFNLARIIFLFG